MEMKTFIGIVVIFAAVGYYFDISPTDFLPSLPTNDAARERHPSRSAAQSPATQPQPSTASTPIAVASDGSLATRWSPEPSPSPKKP